MALFLVLFAWGKLHHERPATPNADAVALTKLRYAFQVADSAREAYEELYAQAVAHASADSLVSWVHARAARPLPRGLDTVLLHDTLRLAGVSGSPPPGDSIAISRQDAQRVLIRDSVLTDSAASAVGQLSVSSAAFAQDTLRLHREANPSWWTVRHLTISAAVRLGLGTFYPGASVDYSVGPVVAGTELTTGSASVRLGWRF
jgi:hypothetical protein